MANPPNYHYLSDEQYNKLKFRTRTHYARILSGLRKMYGQADEVDGAVEALMFITEQTWQVVRGKDKPIKAPEWYRYQDDKYRADD